MNDSGSNCNNHRGTINQKRELQVDDCKRWPKLLPSMGSIVDVLTVDFPPIRPKVSVISNDCSL